MLALRCFTLLAKLKKTQCRACRYLPSCKPCCFGGSLMYKHYSPSLRVDPSKPAPNDPFCLPGKADGVSHMGLG